MDDLPIESDSALQFRCPRCGQLERDDYEVVDLATPVDWRCGACRRLFNVLVCDCERCGTEVTSVALSLHEQPPAAALSCPACGTPCHGDEELDYSDDFV